MDKVKVFFGAISFLAVIFVATIIGLIVKLLVKTISKAIKTCKKNKDQLSFA